MARSRQAASDAQLALFPLPPGAALGAVVAMDTPDRRRAGRRPTTPLRLHRSGAIPPGTRLEVRLDAHTSAEDRDAFAVYAAMEPEASIRWQPEGSPHKPLRCGLWPGVPLGGMALLRGLRVAAGVRLYVGGDPYGVIYPCGGPYSLRLVAEQADALQARVLGLDPVVEVGGALRVIPRQVLRERMTGRREPA